MIRACTFLFLFIAVSLGVQVLTAQEFTVQIQGGFSGESGGIYGMEGMPMVLAPIPGYMPTGADQLLNMPRVASDLQLLPEQKATLKAELQKIREKYKGQREAISKELMADPPAEQLEKTQKKLEELESAMRLDIKTAIDDVLLPFQRQRLDQIVAQSKLNNDSQNALQSEEFAKLLNLTDAQKKDLEKRQQEMRQKLQDEIRELRLKRQREVVEAVLTKEQLEKLKSLIGSDLAPEEKVSPEGKLAPEEKSSKKDSSKSDRN